MPVLGLCFAKKVLVAGLRPELVSIVVKFAVGQLIRWYKRRKGRS